MKRVYIVCAVEDDDWEIDEVFSSSRDAEEYVDNIKPQPQAPRYYIREYLVK